MSEFRYCKLNDCEVIFAPKRLKRPESFISEVSYADDVNQCPFEKGREEYTPKEIDRMEDDQGWRCRVVPNLFNALGIEDDFTSQKDGFFEKRGGFGAHEVVIETPDHRKQMFDFSKEDFVYYLTLLQRRCRSLKKDKRLHYISIFKNSGQQAGASLIHSHSQIMATGKVPAEIEKKIDFKRQYYKRHARALMDDLIYDEKKSVKRIVEENDCFIAYCPYASQFAFETMVVNKKGYSCLEQMDFSDLHSLGEMLHSLFKRYREVLGEFAFNMLFFTAPINDGENDSRRIYRFFIRIVPRLYNIAGFELSTGVYINAVLPEEAAKQLRGD